MKSAIFISYRREDAEGEAGRLFDDLVRTYGSDSVFMDVAGIQPGTDFRKAIDENVAACGVFLTVIGPNWVSAAHPAGGRRLDDSSDFVRLEVGSALARNIAVIPVLVHDAEMPRVDQLPDNIKDLAYRNSVEISHARWNSDVQLLIAALKQYVEVPRHEVVIPQPPPPVPPSTRDSGGNKHRFLWGGSIAVLIAIAAIGYFALRPHPHPDIPGPVMVASAAPQEPMVGAAAPEPMVGAAGPSVEGPLSGSWTNPNTNSGTDALTALRITGTAPQYRVEPFGKCARGVCSWGSQTLNFDGQKMEGRWSLSNTEAEKKGQRVAIIQLLPVGANLIVNIQNDRVKGSGESTHKSQRFEFIRAH